MHQKLYPIKFVCLILAQTARIVTKAEQNSSTRGGLNLAYLRCIMTLKKKGDTMNTVSRRTFTLAGMASCLGLAVEGVAAPALKEQEITKPPNLIFLLTDDHRKDGIGYMGNPLIHTPCLDTMAGEGVAFNNAYVTTSICASSRASTLSGQYVCRHGIDNFQKTFDEAHFEETYPARLRKAGYTLGFVGKYGVGQDMPKQAFDSWQGFGGQGRYEQEDAQGNYKHLTQLQEEQALGFLDQYGKTGPFCLSVSFKAPHCQDGDPRQFIYDPQYESLYQDVEIPRPDHLQDTFEQRFPAFFKENNEGRRRWELRFSTPELYQTMVKGYYRLITGVDHAVGAIRDRLKALGIDNNTIVIFTGDNGFFLGEHGLAGKWFGYEESIRVPFIVYDPRLPGNKRGVRRDDIVLNLDIAPTLLRMAGIAPPNSMQGRDIGPVVRGEKVPWREDFFYEHTFEHPGIPKSEGVVSTSLKYLRYIDQDPVYEELFDLRKDPHEIVNLALDPAYSGTLKKMRNRYRELKESARV